LAPSKTEEEPTRSFSVRRAGNVGAPATQGSFAPSFGKKKKNTGWWWDTWIYQHPSREPLGASSLKGWAVGAVGEKSPQEKLSHKNTKPSAALRSRKGGMLIGYSG
jgi:hypothetical protein